MDVTTHPVFSKVGLPAMVPRPLLRRLGRVGLLFFLVTVPAACMLPPDRLVLFPTRGARAHIGATRTTLPSRDGALELWTARSRPATAARAELYVLRFYGNADRADPNVGPEIREQWSRRDTVLWGVNYPGYGGSDGAARLDAIGPAALAAYDALRQEAGPDRPILVFGTSLGTTAALHVAAQRPDVTGLILQNPPPIRQIILRGYGWWNLWLIAGPLAARIPAALDSVANARATGCKAAFLLAENDEMVAPKYQRLVVDAYLGPKRIVTLAGARHNSPIEGKASDDFEQAVEWLLERDATAPPNARP